MKTWTLALLAVALIGAGFGLHALTSAGSADPAPAPVDGARSPEAPAAAPPARPEPGASAPSAAPDAEPSARAAPTLKGDGTTPLKEDPIAKVVQQALDEEARETLRLEALALSKSRRNHPAAALRWKALLRTAETTEEEVEALAHLARAQAGSREFLPAVESYRALLKLPAEKPYYHHGYRLQIATNLHNAKDYRGALAETDRLRGDAEVAAFTKAGASWMRVLCLDALGDADDARAAAQELIDDCEGVAALQHRAQQARTFLARPE